MSDVTIPAEAQQLAEQTGAIANVTGAIVIATTQDYELAGERLKQFSAKEREVEDMRKKLKAPILAAGKAIDAFFDAPLKRLSSARAAYKTAMLGYQQEEEKKRRELQAQAEETARKEREKLEARAAKAAEKGQTAKAEALQMTAASVVAPMVAPITPKVSGISTRTTYSAEVVDKMLLIQAIAAGTVPLAAVDANMTYLNGQARLNKEGLDYPGVKVVPETGLAASSRR